MGMGHVCMYERKITYVSVLEGAKSIFVSRYLHAPFMVFR